MPGRNFERLTRPLGQLTDRIAVVDHRHDGRAGVELVSPCGPLPRPLRALALRRRCVQSLAARHRSKSRNGHETENVTFAHAPTPTPGPRDFAAWSRVPCVGRGHYPRHDNATLAPRTTPDAPLAFTDQRVPFSSTVRPGRWGRPLSQLRSGGRVRPATMASSARSAPSSWSRATLVTSMFSSCHTIGPESTRSLDSPITSMAGELRDRAALDREDLRRRVELVGLVGE